MSICVGKKPNNRMHADSKKRRSYLALLYAAGDAWRYVKKGSAR